MNAAPVAVKPHEVAEENARKIAGWLATRGGILNWKSQDLSDPGKSVTTPAKTAEGKDTPPPHWKFTTPDRHITDPADVVVFTVKVVETFPIHFKRSGMKITLNNASDRKVKAALARYPDSFYRFGATGTSEGSTPHALLVGEDTCEICIDGSRTPLPQWLREHPEAVPGRYTAKKLPDGRWHVYDTKENRFIEGIGFDDEPGAIKAANGWNTRS